MSLPNLLVTEKAHLAQLLEAVQRCVYFLDAAASGLPWPLDGEALALRKKDRELFGALAAFRRALCQLQDTLAAAMRHAHLLGESADSFPESSGLVREAGVIASLADWQLLRTARNLAAHDYETDYLGIAEHFNTLHGLMPGLLQASGAFVLLCRERLGIAPTTGDFAEEFAQIVGPLA
jgi:hypothetical protein